MVSVRSVTKKKLHTNLDYLLTMITAVVLENHLAVNVFVDYYAFLAILVLEMPKIA